MVKVNFTEPFDYYPDPNSRRRHIAYKPGEREVPEAAAVAAEKAGKGKRVKAVPAATKTPAKEDEKPAAASASSTAAKPTTSSPAKDGDDKDAKA